MADQVINVIKPQGRLSFSGPQMKMSPKLLMVLTVILAVVSVITAILLYQRRSEPIAPNAPIPAPAAGEICGGLAGALCSAGQACQYAGGVFQPPFPDASGVCVPAPAPKTASAIFCEVAFTITASPSPTPTTSPTPTPTPTPSPTPTPTPTPSPTPGVPNNCNGTCGSNANCGSGLVCDLTSGRCRNASCLADADCVCAGQPTPTPTPSPITSVPTPTPTTTLTEAGSVAGTWTISLAGIVLLIAGAALMFAF